MPPTNLNERVLTLRPVVLPVNRNSRAKIGFDGKSAPFVMHSLVNQVTASSRVMMTIASAYFMSGISVIRTSSGNLLARASKSLSGFSVLCAFAMYSIALPYCLSLIAAACMLRWMSGRMNLGSIPN